MKRAPIHLLAIATVLGAALAHAHASDAHEHGVSHLDVILDGPVLAIDFRGAGQHLAGFEHAPGTADQLAAWQATIDGLGDASALFTLPPEAGCAVQSADVVAPTASPPGHAAGHDHDHGHEPAHGGDWQARYRFECTDAHQLTAIEVGLFTAFPAHEEVRYQRFSDSGQGGGTLVPGRTRLELR